MAAEDIFAELQQREFRDYTVHVSFFEIYGGKLFDLLDDRNRLVAREDGKQNVVIVGLQERQCESVAHLMELMEYGNGVRSTGMTGANIDSSRSHAILQILLRDGDGCDRGKFSFIDLAGSERGADTLNQDRQTRYDKMTRTFSLL